jgi:hypothetical protein
MLVIALFQFHGVEHTHGLLLSKYLPHFVGSYLHAHRIGILVCEYFSSLTGPLSFRPPYTI